MIRCHFILTVSLTTQKSDESDSNFRLGVKLWIEGTLGYSLFPSISLATLAGNLVGKLFCVCLWTMQSQVRLIQKETQHKRRSYACGDDCCYSVAVVVQYFPSLHLHFRNLRQRILINLYHSTHRSAPVQDNTEITPPSKNIQCSRSKPSRPLDHISDNPSSAHGSAQWLILL